MSAMLEHRRTHQKLPIVRCMSLFKREFDFSPTSSNHLLFVGSHARGQAICGLIRDLHKHVK